MLKNPVFSVVTLLHASAHFRYERIHFIPQIRRENSGCKPISDWLDGNKVYRFTVISKGSQTNIGEPINFIGPTIKIPVDR